jgi:hypothetical protein
LIDSVEKMKALVESQMQQITDPVVREALQSLLVEPFLQTRNWFYGGEPEIVFPCWVVADDPENNTRYVYCEEGFGPVIPWGLVSNSGLEMGMDSGWFDTLERAFYDSFACADLLIWNVIKRDENDEERLLAHSLNHEDAYKLIEKLKAEQGIPKYGYSPYSVEHRIWKFPT